MREPLERDADYWCESASNARALAEQAKSGQVRKQLLEAAETYERFAEWVKTGLRQADS
jgi:hypothetical protein